MISKGEKRLKLNTNILIFALLPVLGILILSVFPGNNPIGIKLPLTKLNDELFYYKQVEGIVNGGIRGYYGYNESRALLGGFSSWNPLVYVPWIIWGRLFGWSYWSPIISNIVYMSLAMLAFGCIVKPRRKQTLLVSGVYLLSITISWYVLSGSSEVYFIAPLLVWMALFIKIYCIKDILEASLSEVVWLYFLAAYLTLVRGYYVLLFMASLYVFYKQKNRRALVISVVGMGAVFILFIWINKSLCAPYFMPLVNTVWFSSLLENPLFGIKAIIVHFVISLHQLMCIVKNGVAVGDWDQIYWLIYLTIMLLLLLRIVVFKGKYIKLDIVILICLVCVFLGFMYLYTWMGRHLIGINLAMLIYLIFSSDYEKIPVYIAGIVICIGAIIICGVPNLWYGSEELDSLVINTSSELDKKIVVYEDRSWDNTAIWLSDGDSGVDYRVYFALPKGMAISCCRQEYILSNWGNLKSKYIAVKAGSSIDELCENDGCEIIWERNGYRLRSFR